MVKTTGEIATRTMQGICLPVDMREEQISARMEDENIFNLLTENSKRYLGSLLIKQIYPFLGHQIYFKNMAR